MNRDEITIDIKDLIRTCLSKWKILLAGMLIGAILLDGAGAVKSVKNAKAVEAQLKQQEENGSTADKLAQANSELAQLSERERSEVQTAVSLYTTYQKQYVDGMKYLQASVKMNLDATSVPTLLLQYVIDNHYTATYPVIEARDTTKDIADTLASYIVNEETSSAIAAVLGVEENAAYTQELLSTEYNDNHMLNITIVAQNKENCEAIADIVKQKINESNDTVRKSCGDYDITLASENYYEEADSNLMTTQQQMMTSMNNLKNAIYNLPNGMSEAQKKCYTDFLDAQDDEELTYDEENANVNENISEEITVPAVEYVNLKYIVLGVALGLCVAGGWIVLRYILAEKLRVAGELEKGYGLSVLGHITGNMKKIPLFRQPYEAFTEEEQLQMITAGVQITAEKENMQSVFVTGTALTEECQKFIGKISESVNAKGVACAYGKSIIYDPESAEKMAAAGGVVLVEQMGVSRFDEIAREKEMCHKYHIPVIGCVVVE